MTGRSKTCWIIAGPNGAGKTTFALNFLPTVVGCKNFINADAIAAGLSPLSPERELFAASRIFLQEIKTNIQKGANFAFETTLSGRTYINLVKQLIADCWHVHLVYLALLDVEQSKLRVAERVAHGGHDIPVKDIERRFSKSLKNLFTEFMPLASELTCYLNHKETPTLVFEQIDGKLAILDETLFRELKNTTKS